MRANLHEILLDDKIALDANRKHASLGADVAQVSRVKAIGKLAHSEQQVVSETGLCEHSDGAGLVGRTGFSRVDLDN